MAEWKKVVVSGSAISQLDNDANYLTSAGSINSASHVADAIKSVSVSDAQITFTQFDGDTSNVTVNNVVAANTASVLANARSFTTTGDVVLTSANFDGSENFSTAATIQAGAIDPAMLASGTRTAISGALGANAALIRSLDAATISGSLGANAALIRSLDAATISGSLGANAALIRSLTATAISGAFTDDSASIASDIADLVAGAYDLDFAGDTGGDLVITDGEKLTVAGGTNVSTAGSGNTLTVNLDSAINLTSVTASILGNVDGDVTGDLTGNVTGNVTGDVTGRLIGTADTASYIEPSAIDGDIALGSGTSGNYVATVTAGTGITSTGAVSGEGIAHSLSVDYGTTAGTALQGNTAVDNVSVANLKTALAGGFSSNAVTIGDSDDVVTIGNNLVITGDLTVNGDNLVANVTNLAVDDRYILLNSGSAAGDSGIVFGGSLGTANSGMALILDDSDDRLVVRSNAFDPDLNADATLNTTNHYFVAGAFSGSEANAATAGANKLGNIRVEGDIYIYA